MKNNKFIKATSIVMSAVVAGMAMGNGACYAAQTKLDTAKTKLDTAKKKLDEAKKRVESTTSQIVTDGRDFVNKVSNRDVLFFTAGSCTAAAIALGAAYYGYPNGLEDLAKHIVKVDVEDGEVKLLALHLKNYKFKEETADAFLLVSADPREAVAASVEESKAEEVGGMQEEEEEESKECGEKKETEADGEMLRVNVVYKVASVGESKFKALMDNISISLGVEETAMSGKLELVTIDASCLFGARRNTGVEKIDKDFANGLISSIEDSAKLSGSWLGIFGRGSADGAHKKGEEEAKSLKFELELLATKEISTDAKKGSKVGVKLSEDDEKSIEAELAADVKAKIEIGKPVKVIFETKDYKYSTESGKYTVNIGGKYVEAELVKEEKKA